MKVLIEWLMAAGFAGSILILGLEIGMITDTNKVYAGDGKSIFLDNKCNKCHTVKSQDIKLVDDEPSDAPDLSNVGSKHDSDFLHKWLKKEVTIDDKKHPKQFKGSDGDLGILVNWLSSLVEK